MSDPKRAPANTSGRFQEARVRVRKLVHSRQRSMLGVPEIVGLAASAVMLLAVVFAYFYFLAPAHSRQKGLEAERARLQQTLRESQVNVDTSKGKQATIEQINQSLADFESQRLAQRNEGRMVLYDELNTLIRRNSLRNTSGPTYVTLEALGSNAKSATANATRPANTKLQSVFPGIGVSVTVEGQYQNLRRFVRDIEASNQFIVISAVELQGVTDASGPGLTPEGTPAPARPTLVSLRLDMATYFRREAATDAATQPEETGTR